MCVVGRLILRGVATTQGWVVSGGPRRKIRRWFIRPFTPYLTALINGYLNDEFIEMVEALDEKIIIKSVCVSVSAKRREEMVCWWEDDFFSDIILAR